MLVLTLACVPIALIWANASQILLLIGPDQDISAEAGAYARWTIPSLVPYVPFLCHIRFLQTQSIVVPVMVSSGIMALSHAFVCWALVYKAGMGRKGVALSAAISYCTNLVILTLYVRLSGTCKRTWTGFSTEAFNELRQFAELAVPSAMMVCLEWWSFELLVLLSGLLPNPKPEASVLSIWQFTTRLILAFTIGQQTSSISYLLIDLCVELCSLNTGSLMFMVPFGLYTAISTRISNELCDGQPRRCVAVRPWSLSISSSTTHLGSGMLHAITDKSTKA